ncbi:hypothetical protein [Methylobacterium sp. CM6247]
MSTFSNHSAFRPGRARELQVLDLNDIRAVLPLEADAAALAVWRAMRDTAAVSSALRALEALPAAVREHVLSMAAAISAKPTRRAA